MNTQPDADPLVAEIEAGLEQFRQGIASEVAAAESTRPATPPPSEPKAAEPVRLRTGQAVEKTVAADLANFLATGERMLERARQRMLSMESTYRVGRAQLLAQWERRLAEVAHEGTEELRAFDAAHAKEMQAAETMMEKLTTLRE